MLKKSRLPFFLPATGTLLLLCWLAACSVQQTDDNGLSVALGGGVHYQLQPPTGSETRVEKVVGTYRGQTQVLLMQTETTPGHVVLAGLSASGTRLFSLTFDGAHLADWQSPLFTAPFRGQYVLADYQLTHLPLAQAQRGLVAPASLTEQQDGSQRIRRLRNATGHEMIRIEYQPRHTRYCHLERDYCLLIEPLNTAAH